MVCFVIIVLFYINFFKRTIYCAGHPTPPNGRFLWYLQAIEICPSEMCADCIAHCILSYGSQEPIMLLKQVDVVQLYWLNFLKICPIQYQYLNQKYLWLLDMNLLSMMKYLKEKYNYFRYVPTLLNNNNKTLTVLTLY